jgi:hypothetical protein
MTTNQAELSEGKVVCPKCQTEGKKSNLPLVGVGINAYI